MRHLDSQKIRIPLSKLIRCVKLSYLTQLNLVLRCSMIHWIELEYDRVIKNDKMIHLNTSRKTRLVNMQHLNK